MLEQLPSVLVVDDEHHILELLTALLEDEGYRVRQAVDGIAALAEIERSAPDLVLTDVTMPRLNGLELTKRLRERGIPTIVMSAVVHQVDDPCLIFIAKPFEIEQLLRLVSEMLAEC